MQRRPNLDTSSQCGEQTQTLRLRQLAGPQLKLPRHSYRLPSTPPLGCQLPRSTAHLRIAHTHQSTSTLNLRFRLLPCLGLHPKHQKEIAGTDTPIRSYAKPYCPAPTAHHVSAADSSCSPGRSCTSTTTTTTALNSEASPTPNATSEPQPRKPEQNRSPRSKGPSSQYAAGKTHG
jgi:hypothetical protein